MINKKLIKTCTWILIILTLTQITLALGLRPTKKYINYDLNPQTHSFKILNKEAPTDVQITVEGELADYIEILTKETTIPIGQLEIQYKTTFPESLASGTRTAQIIIEQAIPEQANQNTFTTKFKLVYKIFVEVPPKQETTTQENIQQETKQTQQQQQPSHLITQLIILLILLSGWTIYMIILLKRKNER